MQSWEFENGFSGPLGLRFLLIGCEELEQDMGTLLRKQAHGHERKLCMWPCYNLAI